MKNLLSKLPILFGIVLATAASAQITPSGGGQQFRLKFTKGKKTNFSASVKQVGAPKGQGLSVIMPFALNAASVQGNVWSLQFEMGAMSMNGQPISQPTSTPIKVDTLGKVVSGNASRLPQLASYPSGAVKPGASWTMDSNLALAGGSKAKMTYTFVKMTAYKGKPVAQLSVKLTGAGSQKADGLGTMFMSTADGLPLHGEINVTRSTGQPNQPPVKLLVTLDRS